MKQILIILSVLLLISCTEESKIDYAVLTGKIESPTADLISIEGNNLKSEINLKDDGTFADTLRQIEPGFYTLGHGREITIVYLTNGQSLNLNLDTKSFDESLIYTGQGSVENNYLAKKSLANDKIRSKVTSIYSKGEKDFMTTMDSLNIVHTTNLSALKDVDENFVNSETNNIKYDHYNMLGSYGQRHAYYTKNPDFKVSENFLPKEMEAMTFEDETHYKNSDSYRQMAFNDVMDEIFELIGDDYQSASSEDLEPINTIKIEDLKDDIISYLGDFLVSPGNSNMKELYAFFKDRTKDPEIKEKLTKKYEKVKDLTMGNPSPQFVKYENHKGGDVSLSDLKGKYVYVDVWATWCGPCIREIPSLQKVEEEFKGKNIHFVSTSIDVATDKSKWVAMVKDKNLGGMQLMADNDWNSEFVKDYAIDGIPRFILIDPKGNIVSADAPRPSNPKLVELLKSLNI